MAIYSRYIKGIKNAIYYLSIPIAVGDAQVGHSTQDGDERLNRVAVHHRPVLFEVFICEPTLVDNSVGQEHHIQ